MNTWFVAKRLFSASGETSKVSRPAVQIATLGVAIGVAIMIVSLSVVLGFQNEIRTKLFNIGGHIQVFNYESLGSEQYSPIVIDEGMAHTLMEVPHAQRVKRFCMKPGMLKTDDAFRGVVFRGEETIVIDSILPDTLSENDIVLSKSLASSLGLEVGSTVYAYFIEKTVKARRFKVRGIYCTNMTDFDNQLVYCNINTVHKLLGWDTNQMSGAEVLLDSYDELGESYNHVVKNVNRTQDAYGAYYTSMTINEMYPQIFAWLGLLDMDVWAILILMICVSGFTMVSGLLIIIMERTSFIGVMKAMGATNSLVRSVFLRFAAFIILRGLLLGNILAFLLIGTQKATGVVHLDPEVYYVESLPVLVNIWYILLIDVCTLIASMLSLLVPSLIISHIHPAKSIRFE